MPLYIEDTDAYGVKYNANYLRTFERALQQQLDSELVVASVTLLRLMRAPGLGHEYIVRGERVTREEQRQEQQQQQTWDMSMTSPDGSIVYATANGVTIQWGMGMNGTNGSMNVPSSSLPEQPQLSINGKSKIITQTDTFITFRDEFDPHLPYHLPLYAVLKLFERSRSNWIGGPSVLHRMQHDDKVLYVVTRLEQVQLVPRSTRLTPGDCRVTVRTEFVPKNSGMVVECTQTAFVDDNCPMAQAQVTIMALNSTSWRPTKKLPKWFLDKF